MTVIVKAVLVPRENRKNADVKRRTVRDRVHQKLACNVHLLALVLREVSDGETEADKKGDVEDEASNG